MILTLHNAHKQDSPLQPEIDPIKLNPTQTLNEAEVHNLSQTSSHKQGTKIEIQVDIQPQGRMRCML